jgi:predicted MFS family arabinose efflux permease
VPTATSSPGYRWFVLALLTFVYMLNFLDRQLLSILAKPIQDDLQVTDGQLGLLGGLYFALFYCGISLPVAWFADRGNRVRVLSVACALWSAATVASGLASSYAQLVLARMAVGVGEAGGAPPSYAILSDYFPPHQRGRALGLFNLAPPIGQALGVAFGAALAALYDWRLAFIVLGAAGVVAAVIVWGTVREPARGGSDPDGGKAAAATPRASFWRGARDFFHRPALSLVALASGATQFITYAMANFAVLFLMREKGMGLADVALYFSLLVGVAVGGGIYVSGWLVDRLGRRSPRAFALVPAAALALAIPFYIGFVHVPDWQTAMLFLSIPFFLNFFYLTPAITQVQNAVPAYQRTLAGALLLLVMNLIGLGLGPTYLGAMSDHFRSGGAGNPLQLAFYSLLPFYLIAIALYLALSVAIAREHKRA